jgi:cytochrome b6-f complex iron-sulfur subunit/menaquinol-cytochrome c reductase iron-sulfur subunit
LLRSLVIGTGAVYSAALVGPAYRYLDVPETTGGRERWIRVARLDSLPQGTATRVQVIGEQRDAFTVTRGQVLGSVWVERRDGGVRALSAECPHLGCSIDRPDDNSYSCPCHSSRFGRDGKAESGPSPRGMDELATRIEDGWVEVDFQRFRQGIADKVALG